MGVEIIIAAHRRILHIVNLYICGNFMLEERLQFVLFCFLVFSWMLKLSYPPFTFSLIYLQANVEALQAQFIAVSSSDLPHIKVRKGQFDKQSHVTTLF